MTFFEWQYKVVIFQAICVLLILLSVLGIKYFAPKEFTEIADYYNQNILSDTDVYEVLSDEF